MVSNLKNNSSNTHTLSQDHLVYGTDVKHNCRESLQFNNITSIFFETSLKPVL